MHKIYGIILEFATMELFIFAKSAEKFEELYWSSPQLPCTSYIMEATYMHWESCFNHISIEQKLIVR